MLEIALTMPLVGVFGINPLALGQPLPSIVSYDSKHCFCLMPDAARHAHAQLE